jgi:hypothetical protein
MSDSASDSLFKEYSAVFDEFDDMTLARWLAQTLGQVRGRVWRFSHPLIGAYRLAAEIGHRRQIWLKRLANAPQSFPEAPCCRAPVLPLFSRDILQSGLICQHCSETLVAFEEMPEDLQSPVKKWADEYAAVHAVAHWEDNLRRGAKDYDQACEDAAGQAEKLLAAAGTSLLPPFLEHYPAIIWEDQDECLEVRPEDILI